jgi:pimeloyl-ACP methyl ester carboxylesterase
MGGAVAFQIAVDRQDRLRSLMILNSQPSFELDHWRKNLMVLTRVGMARFAGMPRLARYVAKRMFPRPDQLDLRQRMIDRHSKNDRDSYLNAVYALAGWSVQDRVGQITVPTLILAADQDYTPMVEKEAYFKLLPNARLAVIENSRHVSHIDQPAALNRTVLEFLAEVDREAAAGA